MNSSGILLIDKPSGWTSFDVVAKIRSLLSAARKNQHNLQGFCQPEGKPQPGHVCKCKRVKVGHSGTLDPLATGLLLVAYGKATKDLAQLIKQTKVYEVTMKFGASSETADAEGLITPDPANIIPLEHNVLKVIESFVGSYDQVPPAFSAIKVNGKRSYELAREGKTVVLEPRTVEIAWIKDVHYSPPELTFVCQVSSGTYIRSLVVDIASELGAKAYMTDLRRLKIGDYSIENASKIEDLAL